MRFRHMCAAAAVAICSLAVSPGAASADWLATPFAGITFGGDTEGQHATFGGSIGYMGQGAIGFEVDFGYAPEFFSPEDNDLDIFSDANVTTLMANVIVGIPIGGTSGGGARPYVSGGAGLLRTQLSDAEDLFDVANNDFGINVGAGVIGFFNDNVGLRGDIRYFRSLQDPEEDNEFDIDFGTFDFWRGTVGVTFRF
jgi:opacity protein-like surface antigen